MAARARPRARRSRLRRPPTARAATPERCSDPRAAPAPARRTTRAATAAHADLLEASLSERDAAALGVAREHVGCERVEEPVERALVERVVARADAARLRHGVRRRQTAVSVRERGHAQVVLLGDAER